MNSHNKKIQGILQLYELHDKNEKMKNYALFFGVMKKIGKYYLRVLKLLQKAFDAKMLNNLYGSWPSGIS